ncbi:hypothetical protein CRUP_002341 [Coryphaenoides rupestris]|nr:hypothetical protein CRUP_002341 [Coryphaenoides rupestris]
MSIVFVPKRLRGTAVINQETIQRLLEENEQLIRCILEYQQILHRNIVYLATIADASPDIPVQSPHPHCGEAPSSTTPATSLQDTGGQAKDNS